MKTSWISIFILLLTGFVSPGGEKQLLVKALDHPSFWSAVHAAEYLIELKSAPQAVAKFIQQRQSETSDPVKQVGVWRVKALYARSQNNHVEYLHTVKLLKQTAFAPGERPGKIHSLETLFKLKVKCTAAEQVLLQKNCAENPGNPGLKIYSAALLAHSDQGAFKLLADHLKQYRFDKVYCTVLLYVCGQYPELPEKIVATLNSIYHNSKAADRRIAAAGILLKHQKISLDAVKTLPEKPGIGYLRILNDFAPDSTAFKKISVQMLKSNNIEHQILAAYTILKNSAP